MLQPDAEARAAARSKESPPPGEFQRHGDILSAVMVGIRCKSLKDDCEMRRRSGEFITLIASGSSPHSTRRPTRRLQPGGEAMIIIMVDFFAGADGPANADSLRRGQHRWLTAAQDIDLPRGTRQL